MIKNITKKLLAYADLEIRSTKPDVNRSLYLNLFGKESVEKRRFYNICAGGHLGFGGMFDHPFWTNIDLDKPWPGGREFNPETDVAHDLLSLQPIPLETGSAELVYSRFSVEHVNDEAAQIMFNEIFRALKKGGVFRVVSPNIDLDYRAYLRGDLSYFIWREMFSTKSIQEHLRYKIPLNQASIHQVFLSHFASNVSTIHNDGASERISDEQFQELLRTMPFEDALDYCASRCSIEKQRIYPQNHINWWNQQKFERMLRKAGFKNVYTTCPHQSVSPAMRRRGFDDLWNEVAIYMETIRD